MTLSNKSVIKKLEAMSPEHKAAYLASGRVTVCHVEQVVDTGSGKRIKRFYAAKIRGVVVGDNGEWKHETPEAAKEYGNEVLKHWKDEFLRS